VNRIEVEGATKRFGASGLTVFEDLALGVEEGETLCILGPSGCGKTTLLRAMHGLVRLDGGRILIAGQQVRALAIDPAIMLMDEPFAALDAQTREILQEELLRVMQRPDERKTMVFITHSIDEAILLGDRIAVMSARPGRIQDMLDVPFARPRNGNALRADPRFAELRAHIWNELQAPQREVA
jgi:ABC-type nitrate/sulfonate/bicarbonate transport system ATPase subunit